MKDFKDLIPNKSRVSAKDTNNVFALLRGLQSSSGGDCLVDSDGAIHFRTKNPTNNTTSDSAGESEFAEYEVIECPIEPSGENPTGQAYYTLRLSSSDYSVWVDDYQAVGQDPGYPIGAYVLHPDTNRLYLNVQPTGLNVDALTEETWSLQEEIQVTKIWGYGTETILNFIPIIPVGAHVWVFFDGTTPYILGTFDFVGDADSRTITMVTDIHGDRVVSAVFA